MPAPTVVLVHGAFADASSYSALIPELFAAGIAVLAPANPNRGLSADAAHLASIVGQIDGPVLLVGHSYGGAVITVAGIEENVAGLVYLAGYALDEGESLGQIQSGYPDADLATALVYRKFPVPGGEDGIDVSVEIDRFPAIFAHDLDLDRARVLAVSQRPLAAAAFGEPAPVAAWKSKPAWAVVATADHAINPDVQRFGYKRAGAETIELDSSHLVMHAHAKEVAAVIQKALQAVGG